jgi:hypothetical protein
MYTKENFEKSFKNEIRIIKHLATKVPEGMGDYRPSPAQRSTLELMQYLSGCGASTMKAILTGDSKTYTDYNDHKASVTLENFAEKMDFQEKQMTQMFAQFKDEDFTKEVDFYGVKTGAEHLVDGVLKTFAAYRMQLFLYVKACGAYVTTMDVWAGMDTPPKN